MRRFWRESTPTHRAIVVFLLGFIVFALARVQDFLAIDCHSGHGILVVEAWIPAKSLRDAVRAFRQGNYQYFVLAGGPLQPNNQPGAVTLTYADLAEREIRLLDNAPAEITKVAAGSSRTRTFATATAFSNWLKQAHPEIKSVDVFTEGVHARKSRALFRYALGADYAVGVIAGPEHSYDRRLWIVSPRGVWTVARNVVGYFYSAAAILLDRHGWKVLSAN